MGHTVGDAADRAVKRSEKKTAAEMTPAELINELRKNYRANLYIPMHQIGALLADYDAQRTTLKAQYDALTELNETVTALQHDVQMLEEEKKTMTDTVFGLTQNVQAQLGKLAAYEATKASEVPYHDTELHRMDDDGGAQLHPEA